MKKKTDQIKKKVMEGVVTSDKMNKTIVVSVSRFVKHPKYGKYMTIDKKYKVHDEDNTFKVGDKVSFVESRPISKDKSFVVVNNK